MMEIEDQTVIEMAEDLAKCLEKSPERTVQIALAFLSVSRAAFVENYRLFIVDPEMRVVAEPRIPWSQEAINEYMSDDDVTKISQAIKDAQGENDDDSGV